jgi:hypothetical protein
MTKHYVLALSTYRPNYYALANVNNIDGDSKLIKYRHDNKLWPNTKYIQTKLYIAQPSQCKYFHFPISIFNQGSYKKEVNILTT